MRPAARPEDCRTLFVLEASGPPLEPEALEHLFEPFTPLRADGSDAVHGVKLSPYRGFSESLGGTLEAATRAEGGRRFSFSLPVRG